jgi:small subunit ribosomal protein S10e
MIIPTDERLKIWRILFSEGVLIAKKDSRSIHKETGVRNLFVMNALKSLKSKGFVKENFTWQHYHWALTDEGIAHLREQLHLPENVMPNTLKRTQEPQPRARPWWIVDSCTARTYGRGMLRRSLHSEQRSFYGYN